MKQTLGTFLFILFSMTICFSQTESIGDKVLITTIGGDLFSGEILEINENYIIINSLSLGETKIDKNQIKKIDIQNKEDFELDKNGYPIDFHGSTHHLLSSSAYSLKKGQSYYENIWIFWNSATFGITDHFSISTGGEIASVLFAGRFPIVFVSPKLSTNSSGNFNAALSTTFFTSPADDFIGIGVIQGLFTFGGRNNNFTIGTGMGFTTEGFDDNVFPLSMSCIFRLSKKISFVSDNFVVWNEGFDNSSSVLSAALRIHAKKPGVSFTAGLFRPLSADDIKIGLPFVSGTIPF